MINLKKIISQLRKESKRGYRPGSAPDSVWNRSAANRKAYDAGSEVNPLTGDDEEPGNDMGANGAEVAKKMDFDSDKPRSINDKEPLSMMDIVYDIWNAYSKEDQQKKTEEEDDRKKLGSTSRGR